MNAGAERLPTGPTSAGERALQHARWAATAPTLAQRRYHQREVVAWARWLTTALALGGVA